MDAAQFQPMLWRQQIRKELLQRLRPSGRDTAAAVGPNSGGITSHDFLANSSWGFEGGGWECEAGEGGESKKSPLWLGGDRLAVTGLRSDGKKPSLLAERYPRAKSCIGTCEDGLTELGELSGYNQTVKYDKFGQVRREITKIGAKSDRLMLGTKEWNTTYDLACTAGLAPSQMNNLQLNTLTGQTRSKRVQAHFLKSGSRQRCVSVAGGHSSSSGYPDSPTIHIIAGHGHSARRGCPSKLDLQIQDLAWSLRHQGRVPQVEKKGPPAVRPPSYMPPPPPVSAMARLEAARMSDAAVRPSREDFQCAHRIPTPIAAAIESWSKRLRK